MPDFVHVLSDGRIVKSGGKELALELEARGYEWLEDAVGGRVVTEAFVQEFEARAGTATAEGPEWLRAGPARRHGALRAHRLSRRRGTRSGASRRSRPIAQGTWRPAAGAERASSTREQLAPFVFGHAEWTTLVFVNGVFSASV